MYGSVRARRGVMHGVTAWQHAAGVAQQRRHSKVPGVAGTGSSRCGSVAVQRRAKCGSTSAVCMGRLGGRGRCGVAMESQVGKRRV